MTAPLFPSGQIVATPGAIALLASVSDTYDPEPTARELLDRHFSGDWGHVAKRDAALNTSAVEDGDRILSAYTVAGRSVWVLTEADRSVTTILLPEEY